MLFGTSAPTLLTFLMLLLKRIPLFIQFKKLHEFSFSGGFTVDSSMSKAMHTFELKKSLTQSFPYLIDDHIEDMMTTL